jgi:hypothetical protein
MTFVNNNCVNLFFLEKQYTSEQFSVDIHYAAAFIFHSLFQHELGNLIPLCVNTAGSRIKMLFSYFQIIFKDALNAVALTSRLMLFINIFY